MSKKRLRTILIWLVSTVLASVIGYYVVSIIKGSAGPVRGTVRITTNADGSKTITFYMTNYGRVDLTNLILTGYYDPGNKNTDYVIRETSRVDGIGCSTRLSRFNTGYMTMYVEARCPIFPGNHTEAIEIIIDLDSRVPSSQPLPGFAYLQIVASDFRCNDRWDFDDRRTWYDATTWGAQIDCGNWR